MKFSFLFLILIFFSTPSLASGVEIIDLRDVYRCNDYYCPNRTNNPITRTVRSNLGTVLPPTRETPEIKIRRIRFERTTGRVATETTEQPESQTTNPDDALAQDEQQSGFQPFNMASNGQPAGQGQASNLPVTNTGSNGGLEIRGGVPVVDDAGDNKIKQPQANTNGINNGINPTALNPSGTGKPTSTGDTGGGGAVASLGGGGAGGLPAGPGNYESGGGAAGGGKPQGDSYLAALEDIADSLGREDSFLNGGGSKGVAGAFVDFVRRSKKRLAQVNNPDADGDRLAGIDLKDTYGRYSSGDRVPASLQQFSNSDASPFRVMCESWEDLAQREHLGANRITCQQYNGNL